MNVMSLPTRSGGARGSGALGAVTMAALLSWAAPAVAEEQPVEIDSEPQGATVSVDDVEAEELGITPYAGELPVGVHTLVFELDGYETGIEIIDVRPGSEPERVTAQLVELRYGTLLVRADEGAPEVDGASVRIDGEEVGEAPGPLEVPVGPHHVEIVKDGYEPYQAWIEVGQDEGVPILATLERDPDAPIPDEPEVAVTPPAPAPPIVIAGGGLVFAGRSFSYDNPQTGNLRPYDAGGVPLAHVSMELFPLSRTQNRWLAGLSLAARGAWAFPVDSSTDDGEILGTTWNEYDIAARALFPVTTTVRAGIEGAHGRARFGFDSVGELADEVPDVEYRYARIGAVAGTLVDRYDLRASASYVGPYEQGETADRFRDATVWGLALEASAGMPIAPGVDARVSTHYARYAYSLEAGEGDSHRADGGVDNYFGLSLGAFFSY